jgi:uroporphyrinogen decarboxylase
MTPRERVLTSLNHRDPDKVAIDCSGHRSSGIAANVYPKFRASLGLEPRTVYVYDPVQQLAILDDDVLDALGVDTVELGRGFCLEDRHWAEWTLPDGSPCKMPVWALPRRSGDQWVIHNAAGQALGRMPEGAWFFDQMYWPYYDNDDLSDLTGAFDRSMWSVFKSPPEPGISDDALQAGARALRARTDRAIIGLFGGNLFETGQMLYRADKFFMMLAEDPSRTNEFLDALTERHLKNLEKFLSLVGDSIDVILFGDDLGGQGGPLLSPKMYREYFKPRHTLLWNRARQLAGVKVMLHCCGGVRPILRDLIEAGLDAINPVQISCKGMDPTEIKREYGADLTFWGGGCDTQRVLPTATPEEVKTHVRRQVETLAPGGGFVFQQVHNIQANVPVENVLAMFSAVRS